MKNIIEITDTASQRIKDIISKADSETLGLRIAVKSGGCAGIHMTWITLKKLFPLMKLLSMMVLKFLSIKGLLCFYLALLWTLRKKSLNQDLLSLIQMKLKDVVVENLLVFRFDI